MIFQRATPKCFANKLLEKQHSSQFKQVAVKNSIQNHDRISETKGKLEPKFTSSYHREEVSSAEASLVTSRSAVASGILHTQEGKMFGRKLSKFSRA